MKKAAVNKSKEQRFCWFSKNKHVSWTVCMAFSAVRKKGFEALGKLCEDNIKSGELWWRKVMFRCGEIDNIQL